MENEKPKEEVVVPPIQTDGDPPPHKCPTGQIWDSILEKCVDDIG